jgi:Na+/glutamate symporter
MNTLNVDPKTAAMVVAAAKKAGAAQALETGKLEGKSTGLTFGFVTAGLLGVAAVAFVVLQNKQSTDKKEVEEQKQYTAALEHRVMQIPEQQKRAYL